jgi:hypothetical protein
VEPVQYSGAALRAYIIQGCAIALFPPFTAVKQPQNRFAVAYNLGTDRAINEITQISVIAHGAESTAAHAAVGENDDQTVSLKKAAQ